MPDGGRKTVKDADKTPDAEEDKEAGSFLRVCLQVESTHAGSERQVSAR